MTGRRVQVQSRSYESIATEATKLRYPAPLAERASNPAGFEFWWKMLEYVFALPDPASFPPLGTALNEQETKALARYLSAADEMAESQVLGCNASMTVHIPDEPGGAERVETANFPSKESTRGFTTLFRQFDSSKERASFDQIQGLLRKADARARDERSDERIRQLTAWGKARGRLHGTNLKVLVGQTLRERRQWAGPIPGEDASSPQQIISAYQYGDLIHWGDDSKLLVVAADPFLGILQQLSFLEAVSGLIYLYLGFSIVVRSAAGLTA